MRTRGAQGRAPASRLLGAVYVLFFISGALGLVYEVLWLRRLLLIFGSSVHATSTILTVFFGGLALGSWLFGRLADRRPSQGLLWYAALEAAIGLYALLTPWLFHLIEGLYVSVYRASGLSPSALVVSSFVGSAAVLILPATCMGGTFPLVSRFLIQTLDERGEKIATVYGINTAGAMTGTLAVYFMLLQVLGWIASLQCAGLMNLIIALSARALNRNLEQAGVLRRAPAASALAEPEPARAASGARWLIAAFGASGFSAMAYEVAWTRSLSLVLGSSIYAFCLMLATFLGGMALGSLVARGPLKRQAAGISHVVILEVALAVYGLCSITLFGWLPDCFVRLWPVFGGSFVGLSLLQTLLSMLVMVLPTFWMGLLFPIVSELSTRRFGQLGRRLGLVYAVNTAGGILGSFLAGFWLIPTIGIAHTIAIAAMVNLIAGLALYTRFGREARLQRVAVSLILVVACAGFAQLVVVPSWRQHVMSSGAYLFPTSFGRSSVEQTMRQQYELVFYREGLNSTVSVHRERAGSNVFLKVGGKTDASLGIDMGTQVLTGHVPLWFHPNPKRVLVIGLGSGITLGSAGRYPVEELHCAELEPAVVEGARWFAEHNYHIHDDPRATIYAADGRNFLLAGDRPYDVIISEPSNPWMAGVATLFTKEFYELARSRLGPDGVMAQWLQLYAIFPTDVKMVLKTFQSVFPYTTVWSTVPGDMMLIGSTRPLQLDMRRLDAWFERPEVREDLARIRITDPRIALEFLWLTPAQVRQLVSDVTWEHRDDQPWLEFNTPRALYLAPSFYANYQGMGQWQKAAEKDVLVTGLSDRPRDAEFYTRLGQAFEFRDETKPAIEAYEQAVEKGAPADAWVRLGTLYAKTGRVLKAREAALQASRLDARNPEAPQLLARILWQQHQPREALRSYERSASLRAPDAALAEEIGRACAQEQQWDDAAEYLRSAVAQAGPSASPVLAAALAEALQHTGRSEEAERLLQEALRRTPRHSQVSVQLGRLLLTQQRWEDARGVFQEALVESPRLSDAYFGLGEAALALGNTEEARRWLMGGLRYAPYDVKALEILSRMQEQTADHG